MRRLYFDWLLTCLISPWAVKTIASSPSSVLATWGKTDVLLNKVTCHQPFGKQGKRKKNIWYICFTSHLPTLCCLPVKSDVFFMSCYECGPIIFYWNSCSWLEAQKQQRAIWKSNFSETIFLFLLICCKNFVWLLEAAVKGTSVGTF